MTAASASERLSGGGIIVKKASGWFIAMVFVFIAMGVLAIIVPGVVGLAVAVMAGWLLIFGGAAHLVAAFSGGGVGRVLWQALIGFAYVLGGFYFVMHPLIGLGSLTLLLAGVLLAETIFEVITYIRMHSARGSGWLLLDAFFALVLGGLIWDGWPSSSVWAIGTLVGVKLILTGTSRLAFALAPRD